MAHEITLIKNDLPAELVAIDPATLAKAQDLATKAAALVPRSVADLDAANALFREVDSLGKAIAAGRLDITRPIDELKKRIMAAEALATKPLAEAKDALGKRMIACKAELDRIAAEERRKAEEEARVRAEAERARLEAERQALIAKQRAEHEAKLKAAEEERVRLEAEAREQAAMFGTPADEVSVAAPAAPEAPPEPPPVVVIPEVIKPTAPAYVAPKLAVRQTVRKVVQITDEAALLAAICAGGGKLYGRQAVVIDEKAIDALLRAGCAVVGAVLVDDTHIGSAGKRGAA